MRTGHPAYNQSAFFRPSSRRWVKRQWSKMQRRKAERELWDYASSPTRKIGAARIFAEAKARGAMVWPPMPDHVDD